MRYNNLRAQAQKIAANMAKRLGLGMTEARPHTLILAEPLSTTAESYEIVLEEKAQRDTLSITSGLSDRDMFIASHQAFAIASVPVIGGEEYPSAATIVSWPDPNVFAVAAGTANLSEAQALNSLVNGKHQTKTNQGVRVDKDPNFGMFTIPNTQGSASTANERTGMEMKPLNAFHRYAGGDQNSITIMAPCKDKTHIAGSADHNNYLIVIIEGSVIKGGSTKAYLK